MLHALAQRRESAPQPRRRGDSPTFKSDQLGMYELHAYEQLLLLEQRSPLPWEKVDCTLFSDSSTVLCRGHTMQASSNNLDKYKLTTEELVGHLATASRTSVRQAMPPLHSTPLTTFSGLTAQERRKAARISKNRVLSSDAKSSFVQGKARAPQASTMYRISCSRTHCAPAITPVPTAWAKNVATSVMSGDADPLDDQDPDNPTPQQPTDQVSILGTVCYVPGGVATRSALANSMNTTYVPAAPRYPCLQPLPPSNSVCRTGEGRAAPARLLCSRSTTVAHCSSCASPRGD